MHRKQAMPTMAFTADDEALLAELAADIKDDPAYQAALAASAPDPTAFAWRAGKGRAQPLRRPCHAIARAQPIPSADWARIAPLFTRIVEDLHTGRCVTAPWCAVDDVACGTTYIIEGMLAHAHSTTGRRILVVYANGTSCNMLRTSLMRALYGQARGVRGRIVALRRAP